MMDKHTAKKVVKGSARSWTVYYGLFLAIFLYLEANKAVFDGFLPEQYRGLVGIGLGLGVVLLRFKTTTSIVERGTNGGTSDNTTP